MPRHVTAALHLDYDTLAGADRFGNVWVSRLPPELSAQVEEDPTGGKFAAESGLLGGAPHKLQAVCNFHVRGMGGVGCLVVGCGAIIALCFDPELGLIALLMLNIRIAAGRRDGDGAAAGGTAARRAGADRVRNDQRRHRWALSLHLLFEMTVKGTADPHSRAFTPLTPTTFPPLALTAATAAGVLYPFSSREDHDFFQHLEMHMRQEHPPLLGRDHLTYRSAYSPVQDVVDGDLCEQYPQLPADKQRSVAEELDRSVGEVLKKLEDVRNRII